MKQLHQAQVDWWPPEDPASCVTNAFYAYENAVVAAAEAVGERWQKNHVEKAKLASKLAADGTVRTDVGDTLDLLNRLRKDVSYGDPGPDLAGLDLEDTVSDLEQFADEVDKLITDLEQRHGT